MTTQRVSDNPLVCFVGEQIDDITSLQFICSALDYLSDAEYPHEMEGDAKEGLKLLMQCCLTALRVVRDERAAEYEAKRKESRP